MATTTYTVTAQNVEGEFDVVLTAKGAETFAKKQTAIDFAQAHRASHKVTTRVTTSGGTLVFENKARKPQKKTKAYTRVVDLPEGFVVPEGKRVAYLRTRKSCAILHDWEDQYWVYDLATNGVLASFSTTRQCGRFLADSVKLDETGKVLVSE